MIGMMFLALVVVWLTACLMVSGRLGNLFSRPSWRLPAKLAVLTLLLTAPFADEVIGKYQFESLCKANGIESADVSKARGRRVKVEYGERTLVGGTIMPIKVSEVHFRDSETGEVLIQHKDYYALGGWLMRYTPISMGHVHSMFAGNSCGISNRRQVFEANQISQIN